jgi:hypothetical protein
MKELRLSINGELDFLRFALLSSGKNKCQDTNFIRAAAGLKNLGLLAPENHRFGVATASRT